MPAKAHGREVEGRSTTSHRSERAKAAKAAGLSRDQTKVALRVAKVPKEEFEEAVESDGDLRADF